MSPYPNQRGDVSGRPDRQAVERARQSLRTIMGRHPIRARAKAAVIGWFRQHPGQTAMAWELAAALDVDVAVLRPILDELVAAGDLVMRGSVYRTADRKVEVRGVVASQRNVSQEGYETR